jgi:hypothetical protein
VGHRRRITRLAECLAQLGKHVRHCAVVDAIAAALALDQPRLKQDAQVVADGWLGQLERVGQMAHTGFVAGLGLDQAEDAQAPRIGQDTQERGQSRGGLFVKGRP